jgi:putative multicomponent Na+:H+ antiporter subunit B
MGAIAALVYAILGAGDVALTEALVGTMLAITLYVVAVRSSLVMRLGILKETQGETEIYLAEIIANLRKVINQHHLRLELIEYPNQKALNQALIAKEVHGTCCKSEQLPLHDEPTYNTTIRVRHLFEIMQTELSLPNIILTHIKVAKLEEKH